MQSRGAELAGRWEARTGAYVSFRRAHHEGPAAGLGVLAREEQRAGGHEVGRAGSAATPGREAWQSQAPQVRGVHRLFRLPRRERKKQGALSSGRSARREAGPRCSMHGPLGGCGLLRCRAAAGMPVWGRKEGQQELVCVFPGHGAAAAQRPSCQRPWGRGGLVRPTQTS